MVHRNFNYTFPEQERSVCREDHKVAFINLFPRLYWYMIQLLLRTIVALGV